MTNNTKLRPTSKIIQISETVFGGCFETTVLCEDGSMWYKDEGKWICNFKPKDNIRHKAKDQIIYELSKSLTELTEKYTATSTAKVLHYIEAPILGDLGLLKTNKTNKKGKDVSWTLNWKTLEAFKGAKDD